MVGGLGIVLNALREDSRFGDTRRIPPSDYCNYSSRDIPTMGAFHCSNDVSADLCNSRDVNWRVQLDNLNSKRRD